MKLVRFCAFALITVLSSSFVAAQHPSDYEGVKSRTDEAVFSFQELDREILYSFPASFFAPNPVSMRFRVLIRPDGTVKYVKPILDPKVTANFRLGGAHALYKYKFSPIPEEQGDQWVETIMEAGKSPEG